ncbi:preprotein translocase subunit YajC [Sporolactobacillus sp. THM19-2]|nr:preprotein translocase subunit YajC [Sporolactobacillus sp. THM19-2]
MMEGITGILIPLLIFVAIFYFLLIRPQQKRNKETREMQASLQKGDKIVTIGGLQGTVESFDERTVVLRSSSSKLTYERNAIRAIVKKSANAHAQSESKDKDKEEKPAKEEKGK